MRDVRQGCRRKRGSWQVAIWSTAHSWRRACFPLHRARFLCQHVRACIPSGNDGQGWPSFPAFIAFRSVPVLLLPRSPQRGNRLRLLVRDVFVCQGVLHPKAGLFRTQPIWRFRIGITYFRRERLLFGFGPTLYGMLQRVFWRNGRVVEGTCLENKQGESSRGFKSYFLRQMIDPPSF